MLVEYLTSIGLRSMRRGDPATLVRAFTVVRRVISLRNLSKKIGKQVGSSPWKKNQLIIKVLKSRQIHTIENYHNVEQLGVSPLIT